MGKDRIYGGIWKDECPFILLQTSYLIQAYLVDISGLVPAHHNKVSHTNFLFLNAYKSYVTL